ncbi:hypothetical protein EsDP_00002341 [Epichloe bromicola]|uniref:Uncharacterized protein n=1 Tax=Epichloe bromicola TaxID=79588 RepID=A0ABQ0CKI5_9HYPO
MATLPHKPDADVANRSSPPKAERKKRWAAKVKTGCATCRTSTTRTIQPGSLPVLPVYAHSSKQEEQMFHLLCTEATVKVAGALDRGFWTVDKPRATQTYPAIWHASAFMTAMYKRIRTQPKTGRAGLSYHDQETLLLASIFFTSICILLGDQGKAKVHMDKGIPLFNNWRFWEHSARLSNAQDVSTVSSLVALSTRFELESSLSAPPKPFWQTVDFDKP